MCRLIGGISTNPVAPHRFLINGDNAFAFQSLEHPDGWGVATYDKGNSVVQKSIVPAIIDTRFKEICFQNETDVFIAHIRRATTGGINRNNNHPFFYRNWVFAHNGQISNFAENKDRLLGKMDPDLVKKIEGATDSEVFFYLFLNHYLKLENGDATKIADIKSAIVETVKQIKTTCDLGAKTRPSMLSCLVSDGSNLCGVSIGKELHVCRNKFSNNPYTCIASEMICYSTGDEDVSGEWKILKEGTGVVVTKNQQIDYFSVL